MFSYLRISIETLKPSHILVVPIVYSFFTVSLMSFLPAVVVLVEGKAILALVLNATNATSSVSSMNYTIVLMECFTKSSLLNPWLSTSLPPITESVSIDYETSNMQTIEHGFLCFYGLGGGSITHLTYKSSPSTAESVLNCNYGTSYASLAFGAFSTFFNFFTTLSLPFFCKYC